MAKEPRRFDRKTWEEWQGHRLMPLFRQFLEDQRSELMAQWGRGVPSDPEAQHRCKFLLELLETEWADVAGFYAIPLEGEGGEE